MALRLGISKSDILCIDWDERSLRILEASFQRSGPSIRRVVHQLVPTGTDVRDPSIMGDFIRKTLGEHRIRARRAIVDVPRQDAVLNRLSLPSGTTDELAAMVHLQIPKELPFSKDQAVIDFAVVPQKGAATTCDVWVAAIRNNIIEYYRQVITNAGLTLERIGLRPYANLRALQVCDLTDGRTVMVDVGPSMTEINILLDGHLMYTRAASVHVPVFASDTAGEKTSSVAGDVEPSVGGDESWSMDSLLIEVSRTIAAYRATDMGAAIDRIVLAGTAGISERLVQAFEDRFSIPTQIFQSPSKLRWKGASAQNTAPFSAAIGLAVSSMGDAAEYFDFLHVKEPQAEHRQRARRRPVVGAVVVMFAAAACVVAYQPIRARNSEVAGLQDSIALQNRDKDDRDAILKRLTDLNGWQNASVIWIDYLDRLASVFPSNKECYITRMEVDSAKGLMILQLAAADRFVASRLVNSIKGAKDAKGKTIFDAKPGTKAGVLKDPEYPVSDEVTVQVLALAPKDKKKR